VYRISLQPCRFRRRHVRIAAIALAVAVTACSEPPRDASYYGSHPDVRATMLQSCADWNSSNDPQCRSAWFAENQVVEAEHGPPFHGHTVAWYKIHRIQQLQEAAYCQPLRNRSDPDCVAAEKGAGPHF
jgi:hypothetical protein